jgi:hypothetical protein
MLMVREKLSGRRRLPDSPATLDASSIAILSARLLLDLSPAASRARQYEEDLVRSHLRILYSVHQDRQVIVTGSSPEPLIAEASAEIMHHDVKNNGKQEPYIDVWGLLGKFVDDGLMVQGSIGELIGRTLSILAVDNAIDASTEQCELKYQTPVTVAAYYKALLTDEAWEHLRRSTPSNCAQLSNASASKTFESAFADAYVHFSHYGKANDTTPMNNHYAWALWLRGTAVLRQELTNRAIPIFFSKLSTLSPQSVSMILDQDKAGQLALPQDVRVQSAEILGLFSPGNKLPYIASVHCYALLEDEGIDLTTPPPHDLKERSEDEEAPCYRIDFRGLSAYRNMTESIKTAIRRMIYGTKNALFNGHSRAYGLPLLRQMLPVLQGDPDTTAWFGGLENANSLPQ